MNQQLLERVRLLSPIHQEDVWNIVAGTPQLKHKFGKLNETERPTKLQDFERYAGFTLPTVFPPENITGAEDVQYDFQSLGAQLVENLTAKLMIALFHPSRPFFKGELPVGYGGMSPAVREAQMSNIEKEALKKLAQVNGRPVLTDLVQSLLVTGNGMLHHPEDNSYRWFSYRDYNAVFDSYGSLVECVVQEKVEISTLEDAIATVAMQHGAKKGDSVTIYTGIMRLKLGWYLVWQELEDHVILADRYGVYDEETLPYRPQRWKVMPGRQAGIGVVEVMSGDFHTFSTLAETDIDLMALITDVKTFVDPSGRTKLEHINNTAAGAYVPGRKDDIHSHVHDVGKQANYLETKTLQVARRLSQVFLFTSGMIRDAERVTAEEIREITTELKQQHSGGLARISPSLQRPVAQDLLRRVDKNLKGLDVSIITGLETVSRLGDLENVRGFLGDLAGVATIPPSSQAWLNMENIIQKFASGWGVSSDKLVYTPQEKAAEDERQLKLQMAIEAAAVKGQTLGAQ